jgi:hypothetical protein
MSRGRNLKLLTGNEGILSLLFSLSYSRKYRKPRRVSNYTTPPFNDLAFGLSAPSDQLALSFLPPTNAFIVSFDPVAR